MLSETWKTWVNLAPIFLFNANPLCVIQCICMSFTDANTLTIVYSAKTSRPYGVVCQTGGYDAWLKKCLYGINFLMELL